ncbi:dual specificity protein phosphatase family protein [Candidatus Woesearchaeota archaeon]|nr:dual specificity protein phosphatase family protein [Candidatus Woesearchaeota archaeon]
MAIGFRWQIPDQLAGMGFPFEWDGDVLKERKIGAIVTLTEHPIRYDWAKKFKILHLPTPDSVYGPTIHDTDRAIAFIDENLGQGEAVAVHCQAGKHRTGHILASYLVSQGMEPERALEEIVIFPVLSDDVYPQMRFNVKYYKEYLDSLRSSA